MDKKMDKKGFEAVDLFLSEMLKTEKPEVNCPYCNTKLHLETYNTSYEVKCETDNCLRETFRGI